MKYTIILGLFTTIIAVSAMPKFNRGSQCVTFPKKWADALRKCFTNVPEDTLESLNSRNMTTATREAKCLTLCLHKELGHFVDGKFDLEVIENQLRESRGPAQIIQKLVQIDLAVANAVNAVQGDDCDKTYAFGLLADMQRRKEGVEIIFC